MRALGWDFTTSAQDTKYMAPKKKAAKKPFKATFDLPNYSSPEQIVEKLLVDRKEAAEQQNQAHGKLVEVYGVEGAAEVAHIAELRARRGPAVPYKHRKFRVSNADKQAVMDLPDYV